MVVDWDKLAKPKKKKQKTVELVICRFFTTSGYPEFTPECTKRLKTASKECTKGRKGGCPEYKPSLTADRRVVECQSKKKK